MTGSWRRPAEQILLTSIESGHRTIGFMAPNLNAGVSTLSEVSAEIFARSGFKTLLLDLTQPMRDASLQAHRANDALSEEKSIGSIPKVETTFGSDALHRANDALSEEKSIGSIPKVETTFGSNALAGPSAGWAPGHGDAKKWIVHHERSFDSLIARPTPETQFAFNNVAGLRELLTEELADYAKVILDLPPLFERRTNPINPYAAAAACDSVLIICVRGQLAQSRLENAVKDAKAAGCKLTGVVLNDIHFVPAPVEIARRLRSFIRPGPRLADWLERKIPPVD